MPIVPQFQAADPTGPTDPLLRREGNARLDASQEVQALGNLARSFAEQGQANQLPTISADFGQPGARAIQAIAAGAGQLGDHIFAIKKREAEARNLRDVNNAQQGIDQFLGDFAIWKEENQANPETWESEFNQRAQTFSGGYLNGVQVSPAARDAISQTMSASLSRAAVRNSVDSVKAVRAQGEEAGMATFYRAIENLDADSAKGMAQQMYDMGLIGEDRMVQLQIQADDAVEAKTVDMLNTRLEFQLESRDLKGANETVDMMPYTAEEKKLQRLKIKNRFASKFKFDERDAQIDEDPMAVIRILEEKDADGRYVNDTELSRNDRNSLLSTSYKIHLKERETALSAATTGIDEKEIRTEAELRRTLWGAEATESEFAQLMARMDGELLKDAKKVQEIQTAVSNYDPKDDPYGVKASGLRVELGMSIADEGQKTKVFNELQRRIEGDNFTPGEEFVKRKREAHNALSDAKATYQRPAKAIEEVEVDGVTHYIDTSDVPDESDPDYFVDDGGFFGGKVEGRKIMLSQDDKNNLKKLKAGPFGGGTVEDIGRKNRELEASAKQLDQFQEQIDSGKIKTEGEAEKAYDEVMVPAKKDAAEQILQGLFPEGATPKGAIKDPTELDAWLNGYQVKF